MSNLGQFHPLSALISAALALALGALFGLYPAVAARMPVVEVCGMLTLKAVSGSSIR